MSHLGQQNEITIRLQISIATRLPLHARKLLLRRRHDGIRERQGDLAVEVYGL
jgi:hypothetical protein